MNNRTKIVVSTFGTLAGLAGIEHGLGEILQGSTAPASMMIASWGDSALFDILAGEPAMTVVPNFLVTGILACLLSLALIAWSIWFVHTKNGGPVLMLLSLAMLPFGAGFGPPVLGMIIGAAATQVNAPLTGRFARLPAGVHAACKTLWPWSLGACLLAWLFLLPGSILLDYFFTLDDPNLMLAAIFFAFSSLLLTILVGFVADSQVQTSPVSRPLAGRGLAG